jgi:SAM-dependent methyltransferase
MRRDRVITPELMDDPDVSEEALAGSLRFLERVNRHLGGVALTIHAIERLVERADRRDGQQALRVLDVGTGAADIPIAIVRWARRRGIPIEITGLDAHAGVLAQARSRAEGYPEIDFVQADAMEMVGSPRSPFERKSFDIVMSSLVLHHLPNDHALVVMAKMQSLARIGVVWNDLWRNPIAHLGTWIGTLGAGPVIRHDGRVSVQAAFTRREALDLASRACWQRPSLRTSRFYRFVLWAEPA